jgi:adenylosuccinate lyase
VTIRHWQRTEVGEATEAFGKGQKGSSAMPHKKNPILSENLCGIARLLRSYATAALEDVALWHERDISHSSVERVIGPDATGLADFMVRRAAGLVDGLVVNAARMRENLDQAKGLYFSEAVMLTLVRKGMARQAAYELVQRARCAPWPGRGSSATCWRRQDVGARSTPADIDRAFNLEHHLRHAGAIIDRALAEESS